MTREEITMEIMNLTDAEIEDTIRGEWPREEMNRRFATPEGKAEAIMECREALIDRAVDFQIEAGTLEEE